MLILTVISWPLHLAFDGDAVGTGMLSEDGRCKTLDVSADGYVRAETSTIVLMSIPSPWDEPCSMPEVMLGGSYINQVPISSPLGTC